MTKILKSHIGDNAKTCVILCITPGVKDYEQTLSTLRFGAEAKLIRVRMKKNVIVNNTESYKAIIGDYENKISKLCSIKNDSVLADGAKASNLLKSILDTQNLKNSMARRVDSINKLEGIKKSIINMSNVSGLRFSSQNNISNLNKSMEEGEELSEDSEKSFENESKRETKLAHCYHAGNLEYYEDVDNESNTKKDFEKEDVKEVLKDTIVESLKSNLKEKTEEVEDLRERARIMEEQNYNMANMLNKMQENYGQTKNQNELLHNELAEVNDTNQMYDSLIRFFLNLRPDINGLLNNQLIEKLTKNN